MKLKNFIYMEFVFIYYKIFITIYEKLFFYINLFLFNL